MTKPKRILNNLEKIMVNKIVIKDSELKSIFAGRIIQAENDNRNAEICIYNNLVYKIYTGNKRTYKHNLYVLKQIIKKYKYLNAIKELILPTNLLVYNNDIVGYTMPYANGLLLGDILKDNLLNDEEKKLIFKKILSLIDRLKVLPFDIFIGDIHEKNIIVDNELNIKVIDCDSFIINNKKLIVNNMILMGRFPNNYYSNQELKNIGIAADYLSLFSLILNYVFKNIINQIEPVNFVKNNSEFNELNYILDRLKEPNNFYLTDKDIDNIFKLKNTIAYDDSSDLQKQLTRIRKIRSNC